MAGPDETDPPADDPVIRAGEYVLGVLEGEERALAQRELLAGGEFASAVAWWQERLAVLSEEAGVVEPSPGVWSAIEAMLDGMRGETVPLPEPAPQGLAGWKLGAALAGAAALAAAIVLFLVPPGGPPAPVPTQISAPAPQLIAQLQAQEGAISLATRIDPASETLTLAVAGLTPEDQQTQSPELWVVPEGGAPISLGLIPGDGDFQRKLEPRERELLVEGATLAVTIEERATAPHPAPTTPILVAGPLSRL